MYREKTIAAKARWDNERFRGEVKKMMKKKEKEKEMEQETATATERATEMEQEKEKEMEKERARCAGKHKGKIAQNKTTHAGWSKNSL